MHRTLHALLGLKERGVCTPEKVMPVSPVSPNQELWGTKTDWILVR